MDMVRAGIAIYGMYPSDEVDHNSVKLTPAMEIKSCITYIKEIEPVQQSAMAAPLWQTIP
jgi:alanine racemase